MTTPNVRADEKAAARRAAKLAAYLSLPSLDLRQRYTVPETSCYLRQCEAQTWKDIREGRLQVIRDGARVYVPGSQIAERSTLSESPRAA